jgi:hypothetical protein
MSFRAGSIITSEMLEDYRKTLTVRGEKELIGLSKLKDRERALRRIVPKLIQANMERELNRATYPIGGAFFDINFPWT